MFDSGVINVFVNICSRICIIWVENGMEPAILICCLFVSFGALN